MAFMDAYEGIARFYDAATASFLNKARAAAVSLCQETGARRILDVGCGTGILTQKLMPSSRIVVGIDASPAMLSVAGRASAQRTQAPVLVFADAGHLPFQADSFDLAVYSLILHESSTDAEALLLAGFRLAPLILVLEWRLPVSLFDQMGLLWRHGIERMAGAEHYRRFRLFLEHGGVRGIAGRTGAQLIQERTLASTGLSLFLLRKNDL